MHSARKLTFCACIALLGCGSSKHGGHTSKPELDAGAMLLDAGKSEHDAGTHATADAGRDAGTTEDAGPPTTPIPEADFPGEVAKAYCKSVEKCCTHGNDGCEAVVSKQISDMLVRGKAHANTYSAEHARSCVNIIAGLKNPLCATWYQSQVPELEACHNVLDGTIKPGDACDDVEQCQREGVAGATNAAFVGCAQLDGKDPKRCRAFVATTVANTACEMGFKGTAGIVNVCSGGLVCLDGKCQTPDACDASHPQGACTTGQVCDTGTCKPLGKSGADCSGAVYCALGFSCDEKTLHCTADPPFPWILDIGFYSTTYQCQAPESDAGQSNDDAGMPIAPGSITVTIEGTLHTFPEVQAEESIDGVHVSFAGAEAGDTPPYPLVITPLDKTTLGTTKCGDTNIVLLSFEDKAKQVAWGSDMITPCEVNVTSVATKVGERWQGTFSGNLTLGQPNDAGVPNPLHMTSGTFDVPKTF